MPKVTNLDSRIFYRGPSSRGKVGKYRLYMEWDKGYLQYKKNIWKKLHFKNVVGWEAFPGGYVGKIMDTKQPPRIVLKTAEKKTTEEREFIIRHEEFYNWLYWILRAILKYSSAPIPDEFLQCLSTKRKTKIITRRDLKQFDMSHEVFIAVSESLQKGLDTQQQAGPARDPLGFHPDLVSGPDVEGRTRGRGVGFGKIVGKIGKGGSDTVIFEIERILEPILAKAKDGLKTPLKRPVEPMAVKVPKYSDFDDGAAYKDLVREARILAAIGLHPNIIGLIDAHLVSASRLYLFLEMGDHDLGAFRYEKKGRLPLTKASVVRKYTVGILAGIAHMHQRRIYHLDMKPENVLICDNIPKIIDFGLTKSKVLDTKEEMFNETWQGFGTVRYISPESFKDNGISNENDLAKRDSYAVGMTIFEGLLGPYCKWPRPFADKSTFGEGPKVIIPRIQHWQSLVQKSSNMKKLQKDGLMSVANAASSLIEEDPGKRAFVEHALRTLKEGLQYEKGKKMLLGDIQPARTSRPSSPRGKKSATASPAAWQCRTCNRSFTYKPMRCTCGLMVHADGDPLFKRV